MPCGLSVYSRLTDWNNASFTMNYRKRILKVLVSHTSKNSEQITFVNVLNSNS